MNFEDCLPFVRKGRLIRRRNWKEGRCIGLTDHEWRFPSEGLTPHLTEFERLNRRGVIERSWNDLHSSTDILEDDWEVVPVVVPEEDALDPDYLDVLREVARGLTFAKYPVCSTKEDAVKALGTVAHEFTEAYRDESTKRVKGALIYAVAALATLKRLGKPEPEDNLDDEIPF